MYLKQISHKYGGNVGTLTSTAKPAKKDPNAACKVYNPTWSCQCSKSECTSKSGKSPSECKTGLCTDASVISKYCCKK